jgi:phosphoribosylanthranilate isomerase
MSIAVKICGVNAPEAVEAAARAGADYVGLVFFERSPRYVPPARAGALVAGLAPGIRKVGLFVDVADETIGRALDSLPLDLLQFHGRESPERVAAVKANFGIPVMKAIKIAERRDLEAVRPYVGHADWILFDAKAPASLKDALPGGNAVSFDWRLLAGLELPVPWMLSGGLDPDNVAEAVRVSGARAVDVSSGVEARPGLKDPDRIAAFARAVEGL